MQLKISHVTRYRYEGPVTYGLQEVRLTPRSIPGQNVLAWSIEIQGGKVELEFEDQHANTVKLISFHDDPRELAITCTGEVATLDTSGIFGSHTGYAPLWYFTRVTPLSRPGQAVRKLVRGVREDERDAIARLHLLSARIRETVAYVTGRTGVETSAEAALAVGKGVCQDHSHVFVSAARAMGFPARYVSGYLMMDDRVDQDATHAWAEAHVDGIGWVSFDVSNGISPDERHVRVATGLDYREAAPISGMCWGENGQETLAVSLQVQQ
ncbi:MAG: transglutaminase family protein [Rhodobacter sp.]|nr:transglutaminase family protein [Rhodobacter sp.]MCY4167096.1 transglutaminase family protein [Rhodobacter sp.]